MYFWLDTPHMQRAHFPTLQAAVEHWVDWLGTGGKAMVDKHEQDLRSFEITNRSRPGPHDAVLGLRRSLMAVTIFTTDVDLGPPIEPDCSGSDDEYVHWISPGPVIPGTEILAAVTANPTTEARLRQLLRQITLVERIAGAQEPEWFVNEALASKVRWYRQRKEPLPFPTPSFSYVDWRASDMPEEWPPTLRSWRW